jgi:hypothetical protein
MRSSDVFLHCPRTETGSAGLHQLGAAAACMHDLVSKQDRLNCEDL